MSAVEVELVGGPHDGRAFTVEGSLSDVLEVPYGTPPVTLHEGGPPFGLEFGRLTYRWDGTTNAQHRRRYRLVD